VRARRREARALQEEVEEEERALREVRRASEAGRHQQVRGLRVPGRVDAAQHQPRKCRGPQASAEADGEGSKAAPQGLQEDGPSGGGQSPSPEKERVDTGVTIRGEGEKGSRIMRASKIRLAVAVTFALATPLFAGELPVVYLDHVVAIGRTEAIPGGPDKWVGEATGFFYGAFIRKVSDTQEEYQGYLVTNRHVIQEHIAATSGPLSVRLNTKQDHVEEIDFPLVFGGLTTWHAHPDPSIDVAVVRLNGPMFDKMGLKYGYFREDVDTATRAKAKEIGVSEGLGVFVMGFPMNLVGQTQDYVIVRQGSIARVRDTLDDPNDVKAFLIDSFTFPGNSGSPVVLRPEPANSQFGGEKPPIFAAYLIGITNSYIPYTDMAISPQTKRLRVTFEENSGLTQVIPVDYINETIKDFK